MKYLLALSLVAFLAGCSDDAANSTHEVKKAQTSSTQKEVVSQSHNSVKEIQKSVETTAHNVVESVQKKAEKVVSDSKEVIKEVQKKAENATQEVVDKVKSTQEKVTTIDAAALYRSCAGCHGAHGEKKALGKSEVIKGWDATKVAEALQGYKKGTRNIHGMGGLMKAQTSKLSDQEIEALAKEISKF
ncbi:MAG: hypothetical protein GXO11_01090 [Epsilonproteobacteria bacterium]|nr:hypothetical protein [Campylobacterota bacterium]